MKFTILCDHRPENCNECPFYQTIPVKVANNILDLQDKCILGANAIKQCPLTAVNTIFDTELQTPETEEQPVHFCPWCKAERPYTTTSRLQHTEMHGIEFDYTVKVATCTHCGNEMYVPSVQEENDASKHAAYNIIKNK